MNSNTNRKPNQPQILSTDEQMRIQKGLAVMVKQRDKTIKDLTYHIGNVGVARLIAETEFPFYVFPQLKSEHFGRFEYETYS